MFVKNGLFANLRVRKCVNQVCSREKEGHASGGLPKTDYLCGLSGELFDGWCGGLFGGL